MSETDDELVKRLGYHHETLGGKMALINPDGPEAATRIASLTARVSELRTDLNQTREVCSLVRRQDYFDVPTPILVEAQIEAERWRVLQETAETIDKRRPPVDGVLSRYRARSLLPKP